MRCLTDDAFGVSARADAPPFLILYGTADTTVKPKNSVNMAAALNAVGAQVELKSYDDVSHADIMLALSKLLRSKVPSLADVVTFAHNLS